MKKVRWYCKLSIIVEAFYLSSCSDLMGAVMALRTGHQGVSNPYIVEVSTDAHTRSKYDIEDESGTSQ